MDARIEQAILAEVSEVALVATACDMVNIASPTGEEVEMARYAQALFEGTGLAVTRQEVEPGRANVVGLWEGTGGGKSLMFNAHMDTSNTGRESYLPGLGYKPKAVIKNGMIYGLGIYNMKGALACYAEAARALRRAGVRLAGDLILAAVVGEIEKAQWGEEFVGREYRGYGAGTQHLVTHGVLPDLCILGEPTDLQLVLGHYGSLWVRISTHGPYTHTGFSRGRQRENSIRRMRDVFDAIEAWIPAWEEKTAYAGEKGIVNLGAIRGGHPWRASRTPERTDLFLDVRVPPTIPLRHARNELKSLADALRRRHPDYGIEFETYVSVPGAEIAADHELVRTIEAQHRRVLGAPPKRATVLWSSDASVLTRYGIATVNYGPSSGPRDAEGEKVAIETLLQITKIYALVAAELCGAEV
jgi:acetylornithine deacetylase